MIRGLNRASTNAQDGISLLQTADGALEESHSIIQRIRELSVQAANDTNTDEDRDAIQKEIDALVVEVDRIADDTEFNTKKLLDGSLDSSPVKALPYIRYASEEGGVQQYVKGVNVTPIVASGVNLSSTQIGNLESALVDSIVPQAVNKLLSTFGSSLGSDLTQISDEIGLKIYRDNSSTLAYVSNRYGYYSNGALAPEAMQLNLSVNVNTLGFDASGNLTADSRKALEDTIVHEMMHALMDDTLVNGMIGAVDGVLDSSNSFPKWFKEGMAQTVAGGCTNSNDWVNGGLGITSSSSESQISSTVKASSNKLSNSSSNSSSYGTGYLACMYLGWMAAGKPASVDSSSIASGLNTVLKKLQDGDSLSDVVSSVSGGTYSSLSDFESKFGDTQSSKFIKDLVTAVGNTGNGSVVASLTSNDLLPDTNASSSDYKVNKNSEYVKSSVGNSRNWTSGGGKKASANKGSGQQGAQGSGGIVVTKAPAALNLQIGALGGQGIEVTLEDAHAQAIGLSNLSVKSFSDAGAAIEACDVAIGNISRQRSNIGAYVNRLEHTINNLENTSENTQSAESLIRDTDMADMMVEYSKATILQQAGQSMLAQANQQTRGVLSMLG